MRRGDVVLVAVKGDFGKPRPGVVYQADTFMDHPSIVILPFTSHLETGLTLRVPVQPTADNGLCEPSMVMIDKPHTVVREKVGTVVGRLSSIEMTAVDRALALFLGFG